MGKIAFLFSGQGSQYPGMGRSLYENSAAARRVFDQAESQRPGTAAQCFEGTPEVLNRTLNTQPCLYCVDLAAACALREAGVQPDLAAGFSLGEIAALTFTGALSEEAGFSLVCERARLMDHASSLEPSGLCAVLKLENEAIIQLCSQFQRVYPINFNCPGQLVVAGAQEELPAFCEAVRQAGGRAVSLPVSGGFHSPFMQPAHAGMVAALEKLTFSPPSIPLYANATAAPYGDNPRQLVADQLIRPVLWQKTLEAMSAQGVDLFIEVGAGKTLSGFVRKTCPGATALHVEDADSLRETLRALGKGDAQ